MKRWKDQIEKEKIKWSTGRKRADVPFDK